ncbi:MAG: hypothetical protein ACLP4V_33235 [Methylocella sp.]
MRQIGVVVGNGMNLSLRNSYPDVLENWDTCKPLRWPAIEAAFAGSYRKIPDLNNYENDYQFIEAKIRNQPPSKENQMCRLDICNRLLIGFAAYQHVIDHISFEQWPWIHWFRRHAELMQLIVSFNYDLLVEQLLSVLSIDFARVGVTEEQTGVPIFKPHGSVDFGLPKFVIEEALQFSYETQTELVELQCTYYERISRQELGACRVSVDVVLPTESNFISNYPIMHAGWREVEGQLCNITDLIIIGLSYWSVDRPEIDRIIDSVPQRCVIHIANPHVPDDLVSRIEKIGRRWKHMRQPTLLDEDS